MRASPCKTNRRLRRNAGRLVLWVLVLTCTAAGPLGAAEKVVVKKAEDKIRITADQLITDGAEMWAEFTGEVKAVQGATVITSDRLKIFYKRDSKASGPVTGSGESIDKIVANGNVKIRFEDREAESEQAVYLPDGGVLVLTGEGSRVKQGENWISGQKITLHREGNRMSVEGKTKQRVEAVIFSDGKVAQ